MLVHESSALPTCCVEGLNYITGTKYTLHTYELYRTMVPYHTYEHAKAAVQALKLRIVT